VGISDPLILTESTFRCFRVRPDSAALCGPFCREFKKLNSMAPVKVAF
jgi:hypothetical protein